MALLHSPDVDCLLVMTVRRYRLHLLLGFRLSFAGTLLHWGGEGGGGSRGDGGDGGLGGPGGLRGLGCHGDGWLSLNTAAVFTDRPGSALRSL